MSKKKNSKASKAKKAHVLAIAAELDTKGNAKNSAIESVKDLVVGVVGGGLAGAAIGKPSLLVGFGTSLIGHYMGSSMATSFGMGMMASGGYQIGQGAVNGTSLSGLEGAKERMKAFGQNIKQRLYLDKIIKPKEAETKEEGTNGMGSVQYFKYPQRETQEIDMSGLDEIENAIARSGEQFQQKQMSGTYDDVSGLEDEKIY
ncbi:MAG: hypothetical protein ACK50A_05690 [Sphingobacteriaceae bacterium]